jgi:cell division protein FtsX
MILTALRAALRDIVRSPFRSFILLQGVIWGTVLGVLPPALIGGSREAALERAAELGTDRILLAAPATSAAGLDWDLPRLARERFGGKLLAAAAYAERAPGGGAGGPAGGRRLLLTGEGALEARRHEVAGGRWFTAAEIESGAAVAVLEPRAAAEAAREAGGGPVLGRKLDLGDGLAPVEVIGVLRPLPSAVTGQDVLGYEKDHELHDLVEEIKDSFGVRSGDVDWLASEDKVIVPWRRHPGTAARVLELRAEPRLVAGLGREAREWLLERGTDAVVYSNPVVSFLFSEGADRLEKVHWVVFLACALVGTAVVAAMRVLTVLERREEIAVRRVEGATVGAIAAQFTLETAAFSTAGALAGIPIALLLAWLRARIDPSAAVTWSFPALEAALTVACVTVLGVAGGLFPAVQAARVDPVEVFGKE